MEDILIVAPLIAGAVASLVDRIRQQRKAESFEEDFADVDSALIGLLDGRPASVGQNSRTATARGELDGQRSLADVDTDLRVLADALGELKTVVKSQTDKSWYERFALPIFLGVLAAGAVVAEPLLDWVDPPPAACSDYYELVFSLDDASTGRRELATLAGAIEEGWDGQSEACGAATDLLRAAGAID